MADDVEAPAGDEGPVGDTDVTDLPLDESPEAHIRRAMAGGDAEAAPEADAEAAPEADADAAPEADAEAAPEADAGDPVA